jgi:hypothetical protein
MALVHGVRQAGSGAAGKSLAINGNDNGPALAAEVTDGPNGEARQKQVLAAKRASCKYLPFYFACFARALPADSHGSLTVHRSVVHESGGAGKYLPAAWEQVLARAYGSRTTFGAAVSTQQQGRATFRGPPLLF